jgi:hypothetical protein
MILFFFIFLDVKMMFDFLTFDTGTGGGTKPSADLGMLIHLFETKKI